MFGEGELNFPPILRAFNEAGYRGLINVELSRDSHRAPDVARRSIQLLKQWSAKAQASATR
jgi:sugar phosphate isomerase/epimerase